LKKDPLQQRALEFAGGEAAMQALWKHFFKTAAIKERVNPKLQRQNVPLKYRKHLTEFE
jgi:probable DNA metabolism protein